MRYLLLAAFVSSTLIGFAGLAKYERVDEGYCPYCGRPFPGDFGCTRPDCPINPREY